MPLIIWHRFFLYESFIIYEKILFSTVFGTIHYYYGEKTLGENHRLNFRITSNIESVSSKIFIWRKEQFNAQNFNNSKNLKEFYYVMSICRNIFFRSYYSSGVRSSNKQTSYANKKTFYLHLNKIYLHKKIVYDKSNSVDCF